MTPPMDVVTISLEGSGITDWITAIAACATALVAVVAAVYARSQVSLARETREDVTRPYVVAYLKPTGVSQQFLDLEFKNFGQTAAYDIQVHADPPLQKSASGQAEPIRMFDTLSVLAPGQTWSTFADSLLTREASGLAMRNPLRITYWPPHRRKQLSTECTVDWDSMINRSFVDEKGLHQMAKSHESLVKALEEGVRILRDKD